MLDTYAMEVDSRSKFLLRKSYFGPSAGQEYLFSVYFANDYKLIDLKRTFIEQFKEGSLIM